MNTIEYIILILLLGIYLFISWIYTGENEDGSKNPDSGASKIFLSIFGFVELALILGLINHIFKLTDYL